MTKTKIQRLDSIPEEKQSAIRIDIRKYLKGTMRMLEINAKHGVNPSITQKLLRIEIGYDKQLFKQL